MIFFCQSSKWEGLLALKISTFLLDSKWSLAPVQNMKLSQSLGKPKLLFIFCIQIHPDDNYHAGKELSYLKPYAFKINDSIIILS